MKNHIIFIVLFLSNAALISAQELDSLNWLLGTWQRTINQNVVYEEWKFENNELTGTSYVNDNNTKAVLEYTFIKKIGDKIVYIASPKNQTPTLFVLTEETDEKFIFENKEHDFPQRIIYKKINDDSLHVWIEGEMDKINRKIDFFFERAFEK